MKILVTGYSGFIGSNLLEKFKQSGCNYSFYLYNSKSKEEDLLKYTKDCDFIFNFAAIHRPQNPSEFYDVNLGIMQKIIQGLKSNNNFCPILYTSSIQAGGDTDYGISKVKAEQALIDYSKENQMPIYIYRLTNTFGSGARPNGHSVVATFCYNIQHNIQITINDKAHLMHFYYIDDVIDSFMERFNQRMLSDKYFYKLEKEFDITIGDLAEKLYYFKNCKEKNEEPIFNSQMEERLFKTFESYGEK